MNNNKTLTNAQIDAHIDTILKASGSALRNYTMPKSIYDMRVAMRRILVASLPQPKQGAQAVELPLDFSKPLETEGGKPVAYVCSGVIEYQCARVCVDQSTGIVYSSPYVGLKIRNVTDSSAAPASVAQPVLDADWIEKVMEQAQVFASAWSLVGGKFDSGEALTEAHQDKSDLRDMLLALAAAPKPQEADK